MKKLSLFMRSLCFYAGYIVVTVILSFASLLLVWLFPDSKRHLFHKLWCSLMLGWLRFSCGITYRIEGLDNIPDEPVVVLANHQSEWETMFVYRHLAPICPILKKELLAIPVYGWAMRLVKPIAIDRSKLHEASRSILTQGRDRLEGGRSVFIFPEGTRALPGKIKKYSRSGAKLAIAAGVRILPIAHDSGHCWPAHRFLKLPGTIHVYIGMPLSTRNADSSGLTAQVEQWTRQHIAFSPSEV
ncbi:MAG: lysophospholipid acyltransferase family protein [Gammaproteobacteria bacterium]|jgi:1-acyl-sn-glycerol-3-phosphate acyltransferase